MRSLTDYAAKRDFDTTPEPRGSHSTRGVVPRFSMQKHDATRLHWDLRLEHDGALLSWAVTRGPSLDPKEKRLAVRTEDHPCDYLMFEGTIPRKSYGAGAVMLWDFGWWRPFHDVDAGLASGHLHFALLGHRATGNWSLVRITGERPGDGGRENWLLIKEDDEAAGSTTLTDLFDASISSRRTLAEIAAGEPDGPSEPRRTARTPAFRAPQLAARRDAPPEGDAWWHEVKLDGYRAQIALGEGGDKVFTRSGLDWTDRFDSLAPSLSQLPAQAALIDGEIVAGAGLERFGDVARVIEHGGPFLFYAFDLLSLDGRDLTPEPLRVRRAALVTLFAGVTPRGFLRLSPVLTGRGADLLEKIGAAGGEGLVSKLRDAPYRSGRSATWVKSKVERRGEFAIVGFQHSPARGRAFASLLLASQQDGELAYRGKVGTGFDAATEAELLHRLTALTRPTAAVDPPPTLRAKITWVEPRLIAEVRYGEITRNGHLRHASFIALRDDIVADAIVTKDSGVRPRIAGMGISHPDRIVYHDPPIAKRVVAEYYEAVAERLLAVARHRPLSLLRAPDGLDGQTFFQKRRGEGFPRAMRRMDLPDGTGEQRDTMYLTNAASVVAAVQMGALEFHIEGVRTDRPQSPDRMILDLDPDESLGFAVVRDAALLIRDLLAGAGLESWPMVTGGKGVHVVVPLRRSAGTHSVMLFARVFATMLAQRRPKDFTARMSKAQRHGRVFIDWLRNDAGSTAVAPFSLRARRGAPAAIPVSWDELRDLRGANAFDLVGALRRDWSAIGVVKSGAISARTMRSMEDTFSGL